MFMHLLKFNPNHDMLGRFASSDTGRPEEMTAMFARIAQPDGGFTWSPTTGEPKGGFALSIHPERSAVFDKITKRDLMDYLKKNLDLLRQEGNHLGAWHDPESGKVFLDISMVTKDVREAERLCRKHDQIAYFDLNTFKSVTVNRSATSGGVVSHDSKRAEKADTLHVGGCVDAHVGRGEGLHRVGDGREDDGSRGAGVGGDVGFFAVLKFNPNHMPKGPKGGQFAPKNAVGVVEQVAVPVAQTLAKNYNHPVTVAEVFRALTPDEQEQINVLDRNINEKVNAGLSTHLVWTRNHDGKHYLPERARIHDEILNEVKAEMDKFKAKDGERPMLTVLGGRGGSGKSQLKGLGYNEEGTPKSYVLDGDEIKAMLSKRVNHGEWNGAEAGLWHEEGDHLVENLTQYAKHKGINLVMDLTLKSNKTAKVLSFRDAGFDLKGAYMFLPPKDAATRSARRALQPGGRYVPTDVIVGRTGPDGKQKGGNYNNEKNFDQLIKYFNKGFAVYHNMVTWPTPPVLVVDHRKSNPYFGKSRRKKMDWLSLLKFNSNHDELGRFASGGVGNVDFTDVDRKIIDLKPDRRPLTNPLHVRTLASIIPGAQYIPYTKLPFFNTMMHMQGTDIGTHSGQEQKAARDALLTQQPVESVRIKDLIFTQNVVNFPAVQNFKNINAKPGQVARYQGKLYLLDAHHRAAYEAMQGNERIDAHVLDLDKVRSHAHH